jgi:CheY-like chemotaxis protein
MTEGKAGPRRLFTFDDVIKSSGRVVLVVDDSGMMRQTVADVARGLGFDAVEAASAEEATALADFYEPLLIVLDIQMPGANGLQALAQMRDNPKLRATPVIMLTVEAFRGSIETAKSLGVQDYMIKPVAAADLRERLSQLLGAPQ